MSNLPLCYIASPIKHEDKSIERARLHSAARFAAQLHDRQIPFFCPAAHSLGFIDHGTTRNNWDYWQAVDLPILQISKILIVLCLEGWDKSEGVSHEVDIAIQQGKEIYHYKPGQDINDLVDLIVLDWMTR